MAILAMIEHGRDARGTSPGRTPLGPIEPVRVTRSDPKDFEGGPHAIEILVTRD